MLHDRMDGVQMHAGPCTAGRAASTLSTTPPASRVHIGRTAPAPGSVHGAACRRLTLAPSADLTGRKARQRAGGTRERQPHTEQAVVTPDRSGGRTDEIEQPPLGRTCGEPKCRAITATTATRTLRTTRWVRRAGMLCSAGPARDPPAHLPISPIPAPMLAAIGA